MSRILIRSLNFILRHYCSLLCFFNILTIILIILFATREEVGLEELEGWPQNRSRKVTSYVDPDLDPLIIPEDFCKKQFYLVIMVHSHPISFEARSAIRQTWGSRQELGSQNRVVFLLGETPENGMQKKIQREGRIFGDIIQDRFVDAYTNLSLKSIFMLKVISRCKNVKFLMKADADLYVNTRAVLRLCRTFVGRSPHQDLLVGKYLGLERPWRNPASRYYAPRYIFSGDLYPPFLAGTGYLMSMHVVDKLYAAAFTTPIFHLEDVYITGMCAQAAGVRHLEAYSFTIWGLPQDPCVFSQMFVVHDLTPETIRSVYNNRSSLLKMCENMNKRKKSKALIKHLTRPY